MAKSEERNRAIRLRQEGESIKDIAVKLKVSKSTVSLWCRDVKLTSQQIKALEERMLLGTYEGRLKGARLQHERRLQEIELLKKEVFYKLGELSERDFLIAGIALYWGEGQRKNPAVKFSNSDPKMIKFMVEWFKKFWQISDSRFVFRIGINEIHKDRVSEVEDYWRRFVGFPEEQFRKTTLIKTKNKKFYENFFMHYGTIQMGIRRSANLYYQVMSLVDGLANKGNDRENSLAPGSRLGSKVVS